MQRLDRHACASFLLYVSCALLSLALGYGILYLLFYPLFPFTLAWAMAFLLRPAVRFCNRKTGWSQRKCGILCALLFLLFFFLGLSLFFYKLGKELWELYQSLSQNGTTLLQILLERFRLLLAKIPFLSRYATDDFALRTRLFSWFSMAIGNGDGAFAFPFARHLAQIGTSLLSTVVFFLSFFYFCADFTTIHTRFLALFPKETAKRIYEWKERFLTCLLRYLRAYGYLFTLTFCELAVGLSILRFPYALGVAFLTACLDILPLLGVGSVLIPLSLFSFLFENYYVGIGILLLFAIITVVRQIAEPRIIGAQMGLHPLFTLFLTYIGYRLFGFLGLIAAPLLASAFLFAKKATPK